MNYPKLPQHSHHQPRKPFTLSNKNLQNDKSIVGSLKHPMLIQILVMCQKDFNLWGVPRQNIKKRTLGLPLYQNIFNLSQCQGVPESMVNILIFFIIIKITS